MVTFNFILTIHSITTIKFLLGISVQKGSSGTKIKVSSTTKIKVPSGTKIKGPSGTKIKGPSSTKSGTKIE